MSCVTDVILKFSILENEPGDRLREVNDRLQELWPSSRRPASRRSALRLRMPHVKPAILQVGRISQREGKTCIEGWVFHNSNLPPKQRPKLFSEWVCSYLADERGEEPLPDDMWSIDELRAIQAEAEALQRLNRT